MLLWFSYFRQLHLIWKKRMTGRARGEDEKNTKKRLELASQETATAWQYYDHMVINADLEQAIEEVIGIVK